MRQRLIVTAAATALIASSACALVFTPPSTDPAQLQSGTYGLDKSHANILFGISHLGFSHYYGRFDAIDGTLLFDAKNPEASKLNITVDMASIDTNNEKLQGELKSPGWFDATKFPTATFTSTSISKLTANTGTVTGNLTLHGVTKPVTLNVTFNGGGIMPMLNVQDLGFSATTTIKRSDFGVTNYIPMVGDDVALTIETEFHKQ